MISILLFPEIVMLVAMRIHTPVDVASQFDIDVITSTCRSSALTNVKELILTNEVSHGQRCSSQWIGSIIEVENEKAVHKEIVSC